MGCIEVLVVNSTESSHFVIKPLFNIEPLYQRETTSLTLKFISF